MRVLREQVEALMSVIGPFVYDPLVSWGEPEGRAVVAERTNKQALCYLQHIRHRLHGMVSIVLDVMSLFTHILITVIKIGMGLIAFVV